MDRHRIAVMRFLQVMSRRGTPQQKGLARQVLGNRALVEMLADDCGANGESTATGTYGDWQSFLEWLLAHADEIFALIARLIDLFSDEG